jgi:iron complex outermembrane receptor protein
VQGYHLVNAHLAYVVDDGKWSITLNGSNLANKVYYLSVFDLRSVGAGADFGLIAPPREYSVQLAHKF